MFADQSCMCQFLATFAVLSNTHYVWMSNNGLYSMCCALPGYLCILGTGILYLINTVPHDGTSK